MRVQSARFVVNIIVRFALRCSVKRTKKAEENQLVSANASRSSAMAVCVVVRRETFVAALHCQHFIGSKRVIHCTDEQTL